MARKTPAGVRVRRLVAILGTLTRDTTIPLATLAYRLDATVDEVAADITTLSMSGVYPYDPYDCFPVMLDGDDVVVTGEIPALRGPVRLSPDEAAALAAALQTAGFGAEDPLAARLLAAASTHFDAQRLESVLRAAIATHDPAVYETLATGVEHHRVVGIDHVRSGAHEMTTRDVEPHAMFSERGAWYVSGWCRRARDWRTFRVDRIVAARLTSETFAPRAHVPSAGALSTKGLPVARLRFAEDERFEARDWPGAYVIERHGDGSLIVDVPFAGEAWIARRVAARAGRVEVLEPQSVRRAVRELARSLAG